MTSIRNLLVVEDDVEWRDAYSRTAAKSGAFQVKVADDLRSARALVDEIQFAVAFIDIGLDVNDDHNVDGLLVMEKIRSIDEETSIVVVTGRSGRDVMPIAKGAMERFNTFDIIAKAQTEPGEIRRLLLGGLEEYENRLAQGLTGCEYLRGGVEQAFWDDEMLRATRSAGGVQLFYLFVDRLLSPFLPIIPTHSTDGIHCDPATGLVHGAYWSRGVGRGIVVCFGSEVKCARPIANAEADGHLLHIYAVGEILASHTAGGISGAIFGLRDAYRAQFAAVGG